MPALRHYYEPDAVDCNTLTSAIGEDFGCLVDIATRYSLDQVITTVRCFKIGKVADGAPECQSLSRMPLKCKKSLYVEQYSALLDCWHQLDRGVLAVRDRPVEYSWNGRPQQPRATGRK